MFNENTTISYWHFFYSTLGPQKSYFELLINNFTLHFYNEKSW